MFKFLVPAKFRKSEPLVAVVRLSGAIGMVSPLRPGLTLAGMGQVLEQAFKIKAAKAVALAVNSPGGSPVQSALIHNRIRELAEKHEKPVYAFTEDVAASGGYMLACAADEIYADPSSIIGSIGVISAGFGFTDTIARFGIERRVHTAGARKMMLDPFQPENPDDIKRLKALQKELHRAFIALVETRRKDKLNSPASKLFTGEFWSGAGALELGLVDGLGGLHAILRQKFGDNVRLKPMAADRNWLRRRLSGSQIVDTLPPRPLEFNLAPSAEDLISAFETRALWSRFGF